MHGLGGIASERSARSAKLFVVDGAALVLVDDVVHGLSTALVALKDHFFSVIKSWRRAGLEYRLSGAFPIVRTPVVYCSRLACPSTPPTPNSKIILCS